jgi:hypothetical protein
VSNYNIYILKIELFKQNLSSNKGFEFNLIVLVFFLCFFSFKISTFTYESGGEWFILFKVLFINVLLIKLKTKGKLNRIKRISLRHLLAFVNIYNKNTVVNFVI